MNKGSLNWEGIKNLVSERIKEVRLKNGQIVTNIDMRPPSNKPCFYSDEMISAKNPLIPFLVSPNNALEEIIQQGKKEEGKSEHGAIMGLLETFFDDLKKRLHSFLDRLAIEMMDELSKKLITKNVALDFLENFLDGEFNSDSEWLDGLEKAIRQLDTRKSSFEWTASSVGNVLEQCMQSTDRLSSGFEENLRKVFQNFDHFPVIKGIEPIQQTSNNVFDTPLVQSQGLDSNLFNENFFSLSAGGHFMAQKIDTGAVTYEIKIQGEAPTNTDSFRLSPDGNTVGIVFSQSRNIYFYDSMAGVKLNEIKKSHPKLAGPCLWLDPNMFLVAYQDGHIKGYSFLNGQLKITVKIPSGGILSALEINDKESVFTINNDNTLFLVSLSDNNVVWKKKDVFMGCECQYKYGLKKSWDGKKLALSGDCSNTVMAISIEDQKEIWLTNIGARTWGTQWVPGDTYVVVLGFRPFKVAVLCGKAGQVLLEYETGFQNYLLSFTIHFGSKQLIVGDYKGVIHRLKIKD